MLPRSRRGVLTLLGLALPCATLGALLATRAHAEDATVDAKEVAERCAVRLAIALTGRSPDARLVAAADPQAGVDAMIGSPEFAEGFARFVNAELNGGPSASASDDPVYWLAKHVVENDRPWSDMFVGPYAITATTDGMEISDDADGLGYFRSDAWRKRYAGNEEQGYMLVAAFRILQNTTGLELVPSVGNPGDDRSDSGRKATACVGCHYDAWFALDTSAKLLPKRKGQGETMTFTKSTEGPQKLLGKTLDDDRAFVTTLVASDAWRFNQCRTIFKYVYGRPENQCEASVFDACVDALTEQKTVRAAALAVAKDPAFCR